MVASAMSSQTPPLLVLRSVGPERGSAPSECESLIRDVVVETGLCENVDTARSGWSPVQMSVFLSEVMSVSAMKQKKKQTKTDEKQKRSEF